MRLDLYTNPDQDKCIWAVGLDPDKIPRLRGAGVQKTEHGYRIIIHTRTGGGNRKDYEVADYVLAGDSNPYMRTSPYYCRDEDDEFDCTYANFFYRIPEDFDWKESYSPEKAMVKAINNVRKKMEGRK